MGPVVVGSGERELLEVELPFMPDVARRISFSVFIFWRSRLSRSFSAVVLFRDCSRLARRCSRSLTWRSLRSRKAR